MIDVVNSIAAGAVIANVCAVLSGWAVLLRHPGFIGQTKGQVFNLCPTYLCFTILLTSVSLSMALGILLAWFLINPDIRSPDTFAAEMFMAYHLSTGVGATAVHLLVDRLAGGLLASSSGEISDVDCAARPSGVLH